MAKQPEPISYRTSASSRSNKAQSNRMTAQAKSAIMKKSKGTDSARRATKASGDRMTAQAKSIAAKKVKAQSAYSGRMTKPATEKKKSDNAKSLARRRNPIADYKTNTVRGNNRPSYGQLWRELLNPRDGISRDNYEVGNYSYPYKGKGSKPKKK